MDPKDPKDPSNGNPPGNPPGNPDPNVVALQQKLSERDREMKSLQDELAKLKDGSSKDSEVQKAIADMSETIKALTDTISTMESDKERARLKATYPDILPDLLLGKSKEEIESLVARQREAIAQNYEIQPSAHAPKYESRSEVEKEMERVESDKKIPIAEKFQRIRELKKQRDEF